MIKYNDRKAILDLAKSSVIGIPLLLKNEFSNMNEENKRILDSIPVKYRNIDVINEEINKLSMEQLH